MLTGSALSSSDRRERRKLERDDLTVDAEKRRISLSLKPAPPEAPATTARPEEKAKAKPRKKPLRGGLASHWDWASEAGLKLKG